MLAFLCFCSFVSYGFLLCLGATWKQFRRFFQLIHITYYTHDIELWCDIKIAGFAAVSSLFFNNFWQIIWCYLATVRYSHCYLCIAFVSFEWHWLGDSIALMHWMPTNSNRNIRTHTLNTTDRETEGKKLRSVCL